MRDEKLVEVLRQAINKGQEVCVVNFSPDYDDEVRVNTNDVTVYDSGSQPKLLRDPFFLDIFFPRPTIGQFMLIQLLRVAKSLVHDPFKIC